MKRPDEFLLSDLAVAGPLGCSNQRNNKGRSQLITLGRNIVVKQQQVSSRATLIDIAAPQKNHADAVGDALAQTTTISCSYANGNPQNEANPISVEGLLEWGVDGHRMSARFDWRHGTTIRCAASSFRLIAEGIESPAAGADPEAIAQVGAVIGYHAHGNLPPSLTDWITVPAGVSVVLPVPPFASEFVVPTSQSSWSYRFNFAADGSRFLGNTVAGADLAGGLVRTVAAAPFVEFFGDGAEQTYPVVWKLDL